VLIQHKPFSRAALRNRYERPRRLRHAEKVRFALSPSDPRIHALVVALDRDDVSVAATWRAVGEAAWRLGLRRPCYHTVRPLVRAERLRRGARTAVRAAALDAVLAVGSSRVVDLPIALDALEQAQAKERLVLNQHKPP
jgi:hypothetical protein